MKENFGSLGMHFVWFALTQDVKKTVDHEMTCLQSSASRSDISRKGFIRELALFPWTNTGNPIMCTPYMRLGSHVKLTV